jgi:Fe-S-cluster-containing dehydrogenase component
MEPTMEKLVPPAPDYEALSHRGDLLPAATTDDPAFIKKEAERCLSCGSACLRCVEVCPNRANFAMPVAVNGVFKQAIQIVHVDDLCNECGNCGFFCPYDGRALRGQAHPVQQRSRPPGQQQCRLCLHRSQGQAESGHPHGYGSRLAGDHHGL